VSFLPTDLYAQIERSMPIACVDFVVTPADPAERRIGLILRDSPFGQVWCHLGGRIRRGETIAQALRRHADESLGVDLVLDDDPQPRTVFQWFPPDLEPDLPSFGRDPRKHAIGMSFVTPFTGEPRPRDEALDFGLFELRALPSPLWPGCDELLRRLFRQAS
jgi:ADP-ribose pyrophosphatase YjhB (NUDIX family)